MELKLESDNKKSVKSSSDVSAVLETANEALDDPRIQGVLSTYLQDRGHDPESFGLPSLDDDDAPESDGDGMNAEQLDHFVGKAAEFLGEDTTLAELKDMTSENPQQVELIIDKLGL